MQSIQMIEAFAENTIMIDCEHHQLDIMLKENITRAAANDMCGASLNH